MKGGYLIVQIKFSLYLQSICNLKTVIKGGIMKKVFLLIGISLLLMRCQFGNSKPDLFANLPEPSETKPFVVASPKDNSTFKIGDTVDIIFKRHASVKDYCCLIELVKEKKGIIAYSYREFGFSDPWRMGIDSIQYSIDGDIEKIRWIIRDSLIIEPDLKTPTKGSNMSIKISEAYLDCEIGLTPAFVTGVTIKD